MPIGRVIRRSAEYEFIGGNVSAGRDFKHTNPAFGSFTDLTNLIAAAHAHHIKVVIDFAPNHTSPANQNDATFAENGVLNDNAAHLSSYSSDPGNFFHHNGGTDFSTLESAIYRNLFDLADLCRCSQMCELSLRSPNRF